MHWALLLYLVIVKNGAEVIAKYLTRSKTNIKITKNMVKIITALIALTGVISITMMLTLQSSFPPYFSQYFINIQDKIFKAKYQQEKKQKLLRVH